jgi:CheY-like chemotaxis protein
MRILVVDDEEHLRRMMRLTLEASGYDVAEAGDGEQALRLFGDGRQFEATLLDQRMPGLDGLETLRRMKSIRADAIVIMVTAYGTIELAVDAMKLGATDFVRKPMTPDTLRDAVAAALTRRITVTPAASAPVSLASDSLAPAEIWTTNGFYIRRLDSEAAGAKPASVDHHFLVRRGGDSAGADVVVSIDRSAVMRISRESGKSLSPSGHFWRRQAENALVNYLWSEAQLPEAGRLVLDMVTGSMVDEAVDWSDD